MSLLEFTGKKLNQSEKFDIIGQQVNYCRRPRVTCHILHWMRPSGIMLHSC